MKKKYSAPTAKVKEFDIADQVRAYSGLTVPARTVSVSGFRGTVREWNE